MILSSNSCRANAFLHIFSLVFYLALLIFEFLILIISMKWNSHLKVPGKVLT